MKKIAAALIVALTVVGISSAQTAAPAQPQAQTQQTVTVSGKLELIDGFIGVKAGGTTYYTRGLERLVGFVKDLQEGAQVKLEGYAYPLGTPSGYSVLIVTKVTFGGKDYELPKGMMGGRFGRAGGFGQGGMMGPDGRGGMMGPNSRGGMPRRGR
jgi:hypothetical protein